MTTNFIHLGPTESVNPGLGYIPYNHARRWFSLHENSSTQSQVEIFMTQGAFIRACAHAGSDLVNEVGGWLIGKVREDKAINQEFIVIEKILPASYTRSGRAYLTFTQDSQVAMHEFLEDRFPGKVVVGWYHTHPGMGLFMSQYDIWLHQNFFKKASKVALVIEPHTKTGGFFFPNPDGQLDPSRYTGFHELTDQEDRSVVHWGNLSFYDPLSGGGEMV